MRATQSLIYLANTRIPTERAHGYQIFKMCEAFTEQGLEVEFWHPERDNTAAMEQIENVFSYYGVKRHFQLKSLPCWDWSNLKVFSKRFWSLTHALSYAIQASRNLRQIEPGEAVIYTRDFWIALLSSRPKNKVNLANPVFFEAHFFPEGLRRRWMSQLKRLDGIIVITRALEEQFVQAGVPKSRVLIAPDGVDLRHYQEAPDQKEARRRLQLPMEKSLVVYTGHFYPWKGAHELLRSAPMLPRAQFLLVGGAENDRKEMERLIRALKLENITLAGFRPPAQVPLYLTAADVVVLPNSGRQKISREYTSPLKLFEYMAACRPIVASDLPSLREILQNGSNAVLVEPDNPKALAEGIRKVLEDSGLAERIANQARKDAEKYTWERRSENILQFIDERIVS